jgi:uncharacterized membrane protein
MQNIKQKQNFHSFLCTHTLCVVHSTAFNKCLDKEDKVVWFNPIQVFKKFLSFWLLG